jgi:hypothetical protein
MKTSEILKAAREIIADPSNWMQGDFSSEFGDNTCFCALGAIAKASGELEENTPYSEADKALKRVVRTWFEAEGINYHHNSFAVFNDKNDHDSVIKAFDAAIINEQNVGN